MKTIGNLTAIGSALALLLTTQAATAQQCCPAPEPCRDPCMNWCNMDGDWEFGAHALVFTPSGCAFDFATTTVANFRDNISTVGCQLDWGFRVFAAYLSRCSFTGFSYQWFDSKSAASLAAPAVTRFGQVANVTKASLRLQYQNVDVRMGKFLHRSCGCDFYVFGNARWVDLQYRRTVQGIVNTGQLAGQVQTVNQKSTLQGGALGVGAGAEFDVWCDVGLFGEANILGIIAERSTKDATFTNVTPAGVAATVPFTYASDTCINPELNFRLGLNYTYTCGCWSFVGEVGYEVDYFWNAFAFNQFTGPAITQFRQCEDVGFSGLFFGGKVLF